MLISSVSHKLTRKFTSAQSDDIIEALGLRVVRNWWVVRQEVNWRQRKTGNSDYEVSELVDDRNSHVRIDDIGGKYWQICTTNAA